MLLRQMDGFAQGSRTVVLGATNRKQDLDPALLSRFDASIAFQLPSASTRCVFLGVYGQQQPGLCKCSDSQEHCMHGRVLSGRTRRGWDSLDIASSTQHKVI